MHSEEGSRSSQNKAALRTSDDSGRRGWRITEERREAYRQMSRASSKARIQALAGDGPAPIHPVNRPTLDVEALIPRLKRTGIRALSLFSGGGGLDLGFDLAGYEHVASYEILEAAARTIGNNRPRWGVCGGVDGDVRKVAWQTYKGQVDVVHAGPPCQPFSAAGRQRGPHDDRDMFPEFVRAVLDIKPMAFVAENVPALTTRKFERYLDQVVRRPLSDLYYLTQFHLDAESFGVPQKRRRVFFVGFRDADCANNFKAPEYTHRSIHRSRTSLRNGFQGTLFEDSEDDALQTCMGAREALGLPDIGYDALAPTIRSSLTGPRHTTSILSSASAAELWDRLQIWANGVASSREKARAYVPKNEHFRLSVPDCALLQGFPEGWKFEGPVYMALGQIGNSVPPPMGYQVGKAVASALA